MTIASPMADFGIRDPRRRVAPQTGSAILGPAIVFSIVLLAAPLLLASGHVLGEEATLPALSGSFFALAAVVALLAWRRPRNPRHFTYWDVAGALTFIGIAISTAVEPEQMVRLVAGVDRQP
jgi:MYXO-CTERM domain-containing protein